MTPDGAPRVVVPCDDLDAGIAFLVEHVGLRLETIMPADEPSMAILGGRGLHVRLDRKAADVAVESVPDGDADGDGELHVPPLVAALEPMAAEDRAGAVGRAGMRYRDLLPSRQGGRFIASHITIPEGGPVPDYVHHHAIRFQVITCVAGCVRVVYEDQGPPFVLDTGDCVVQPPGIRHRVLETSPGAQVVEVGCPAEHATHVDHDLALPTATIDAERRFGGQRFVHHRAANAPWTPWRAPGFTCRETGIGAATGGTGDVRFVRPLAGTTDSGPLTHAGDLQFWFLTAGSATLHVDGHPSTALTTGGAVAVPAGLGHQLEHVAPDLELLEVVVPV